MMRAITVRERVRRPAFTLIEMLVVVGIVVLLATLTALFAWTSDEARKTAQGAELLQQWLLIAKQRALRDQKFHGIRLILGANNQNDPYNQPYNASYGYGPYVYNVQFIEQPVDLTGGTATITGSNTISFSGAPSLTGGYAGTALSPVQAGDYIQFTASGRNGLMYLISSASLTATSLQTQYSDLPAPSSVPSVPSNYRIIRVARPLAGIEPMQLPTNVVIDISGNFPAGLPSNSNPAIRPNGPSLVPINTLTASPTPFYDIIFSPSGGLAGQGQTVGKVILWVRNQTENYTSNDQTLIAVYSRTGFIASHPVDLTSGNYYSFTQDGRSSGL